MKIFVTVKQVPDTSGKVAVNPDGTLDRASMQTIINPDDMNAVEAALTLKDELGCKVSVDHDLAIVMIVGEAMANSVGIMARAASALSNAGINLRIVNPGASEISMMFGVSESYCSYAVRVLYKELFRY